VLVYLMANRKARKISRQVGKEEQQQRSNGKISSVSSEGGKQSKNDKDFVLEFHISGNPKERGSNS
jgi:hypothetical protein